ncbi:universal stress protein [Brevibacterium daeguense]|uniref:Universal stress protein n=1 Tax=Brevibacterium daeguense TaxID=909936 RepID=A0ABP8EKK0_9MICO|nr:universal stress protein [Brevibacterium daeguense]
MTSAAEPISDVSGEIIVGVDGSPNSERAFDTALSLAQKQGKRLRLVCAFTFPFGYVDPYNTTALDGEETYKRIIEERITEVTDELGSRAEQAGVEAEVVIEEGDAAGVLSRLSESADYAVVGKRGRNSFTSRFTGSVSSSFASHSKCPVLVVPEGWDAESGLLADAAPESALTAPEPEGKDPSDDFTAALLGASHRVNRRAYENIEDDLNFDGEIVVAIDPGSSAGSVAPLAADWAQQLNRPLVLVTAVSLDADTTGWMIGSISRETGQAPRARTVAIERLQEVTAELEETHPDLSVNWKFFDGAPAEVLTEASRTATLVIVGSRGRGGFAGLLLGSVSRAVLNHAVSPVLVIPVKSR